MNRSRKTMPPILLERCLCLLIPERDQDTITGDLQEEYSARTLQGTGRARVNAWYVRQVVSFVPRCLLLAQLERRVLFLLCCFTALAGGWLGFMDMRLGHMSAPHEAIAGTIVVQALATLFALRHPHSTSMRVLAFAGCFAIWWLSGKAFWGLMHTNDMEGYILLIAFCLFVQAALTFVVLRRRRPEPLV